jgi:hypothetical protein
MEADTGIAVAAIPVTIMSKRVAVFISVPPVKTLPSPSRGGLGWGWGYYPSVDTANREFE